LLSSDPEAARAIVLSTKSEIGDDTFNIENGLLNSLIGQISSLASVYHKPPEAFILKNINLSGLADDEELEVADEEEDDSNSNGNSYKSGPCSYNKHSWSKRNK
jgi:AP-1 complex subunit beta-1